MTSPTFRGEDCHWSVFPYHEETGTLFLQVRKIAPEFYNDLQSHNSWSWVIYQFIVNPAIGPFARIKRPPRIEKIFWGNNMLSEYLDVVQFPYRPLPRPWALSAVT